MIQERMSLIFENLNDPRSERNQRHPFLSLISIGLLSAIAGIDSFSGMEDFAKCHKDNLIDIIPLPAGVPSHDTFRRIFAAIDPEAFVACFMTFTQHLATAAEGLLAIDGKTIRNSGTKNNPLHIVSAWCDENHLVLGQVTSKNKGGSEIEAIEQLLVLLDIHGKIVTIDAMGCRKVLSQQIKDGGGEYVIALKRNQGNLYEDVKAYFDDINQFKGTSWKEWDKGHGRIECRKSFVLEADSWLKKQHGWPGLRSISLVVSTRIVNGKESRDTRFYISSLPANAEMICRTARRHWGIENKLHWVLDVTYNEDKGCIWNDNSAENVDILRKWALNIINSQRKEGVSIKSMHRKASMSFNFLVQILEKIFHA